LDSIIHINAILKLELEFADFGHWYVERLLVFPTVTWDAVYMLSWVVCVVLALLICWLIFKKAEEICFDWLQMLSASLNEYCCSLPASLGQLTEM
jgi:hypothetical protein